MSLLNSIAKDLEELKALGLQIDQCKVVLRHLRDKISSGSNVQHIEPIFSTRLDVASLLESFTSSYQEIITKCSSIATVEWWPRNKEYTSVNYVSGKDPWSFFLTLKENNRRSAITTLLKRQKGEGILKRVQSPQPGSVVCCCIIFGAPFRGVVQKVSGTTMTVVDIDVGKQFTVQMSDAYELSTEAAEIHAQAIHCALYPEDSVLKSRWSEQMTQAFEYNLSQAENLSMMVLHEADQEPAFPPKFIVKIKDSGPSTDFHEFLDWLRTSLGAELDSPSQTEGTRTVTSYSEHEVNSSVLPFTITQNLPILDEHDVDIEEDNSNYRSWSNPYDMDASSFTSGRSSMNGRLSVMQPTAVEFIPREGAREREPVLHGDTNEQRKVCLFYLQHDYCWKKGCKLPHLNKREFYADHTTYAPARPINSIDLPVLGQRAPVTVTSIVDAHTFYVHLSPIYSNTGELDSHETLETLMNDINHPETRHTLKALGTDEFPRVGLLCLGFGRYQKWARVLIRDCFEEAVQVFYVDYGTAETLNHDLLRQMKPEFIHLPHQAVMMKLYGIFTIQDGFCDDAMQFLEKTLLNQKVEAVIKDRCLVDSVIETEVYLKDGRHLNSLLVNKGFCAETGGRR